MSASAITMSALLPPSSSATRLSMPPAISPTRRPTAVEPVKEIIPTAGWRTSASPVSAAPGRTCRTPAGRPASSKRRADVTRRVLESTAVAVTAMFDEQLQRVLSLDAQNLDALCSDAPHRPMKNGSDASHLTRCRFDQLWRGWPCTVVEGPPARCYGTAAVPSHSALHEPARHQHRGRSRPA